MIFNIMGVIMAVEMDFADDEKGTFKQNCQLNAM